MSVLNKKKVVIIGSGFGGLRAAKMLAGTSLDVTVIDRNNYHLFQPLLYQVATAGIAPEEIAYPVRAILRSQKNVRFKLAEVQQINFDKKNIQTNQGDVNYDYLILAVGGETNTFGIEGVKQYGFGLKDIHEAVAIRSHLIRMFELAEQEEDEQKRQALLTFVVVGGGPTGVECSGAISELIRMAFHKDYHFSQSQKAHVILMEAGSRLLPALPENLANFTQQALSRKKVDVRLNAAVKDFTGHSVVLEKGEAIPCYTLIWAAGIQAAGIISQLDVPKGSLKRVKVNPNLQVEAHPEVFAIGDAAYLEGPDGRPYPMVAPVAMQQAVIAAENIKKMEGQLDPIPFVYHDMGSMATIGRNQAVAVLNGIQFKGFPAWVVWMAVHIMQLIGFRYRLMVMINWAWDYLFYDRAVRLIQKGYEIKNEFEKKN